MDVYRSLRNSLFEFYASVRDSEEGYLKGYGINDITVREVELLDNIYHMGKTTTMSELARRRHITAGTLTVVVNSLVKKGYIRKEKNGSDKRITNLFLTEKAREAIKLHRTFYKWLIDRLFSEMPDINMEKTAEYYVQMIDILKDIKEKMEEKYDKDNS